MANASPEAVEEELIQADKELKELVSGEEIRQWWRQHYSTLGHRRLGRLLLGQSVDRMLEQSQRDRGS